MPRAFILAYVIWGVYRSEDYVCPLHPRAWNKRLLRSKKKYTQCSIQYSKSKSKLAGPKAAPLGRKQMEFKIFDHPLCKVKNTKPRAGKLGLWLVAYNIVWPPWTVADKALETFGRSLQVDGWGPNSSFQCSELFVSRPIFHHTRVGPQMWWTSGFVWQQKRFITLQ